MIQIVSGPTLAVLCLCVATVAQSIFTDSTADSNWAGPGGCHVIYTNYRFTIISCTAAAPQQLSPS